jgi:DNA-binding transcriptional LysR family regulator
LRRRYRDASSGEVWEAQREIVHFKGLNLNLLAALDAMLTERSVTQAALRLGVTQPAMSTALQQLREHFADPLLERVGRRFEPTPKAKAISGPLRALLLDIQTAMEAAPDFDATSSTRRFRVAMSTFVAELLYPALSQLVVTEAPRVALELSFIGSDVFNRISDGTIDCCVTVHDRALFDPYYLKEDLKSDVLLRDPFTLAVSATNPDIQGQPSYETFCRSRLVIVRVGDNLRSVVERSLDKCIDKPHIAQVVPSYLMALQMIGTSSLIGLVRSSIAAQHAERLDLRLLKPPIDLPVLEDALIWHSRTDGDAAHLWLRGRIRAAAERVRAQVARVANHAVP